MGYAARQLESDGDALLPWLDKPKFNSWALKDVTAHADAKANSLSGPNRLVCGVLDFVAAVLQTQVRSDCCCCYYYYYYYYS
jgi:hypothetical protein